MRVNPLRSTFHCCWICCVLLAFTGIAIGEELRGRIVTPDQQPAADAQILLISGPGNYTYIRNNDLAALAPRATSSRPPTRRFTRSDAAGAFQVESMDAPWRLVAIHETGIAEMPYDQFNADEPIPLTPWARVEGRVPLGGAPQAGQRIRIRSTRLDLNLYDKGPPIYYEYDAALDEQGSFIVPRVRPMVLSIQRERGMTNMQFIEPTPGETVKLTVGGWGTSLQGTVVPPEGAKVPELGVIVVVRGVPTDQKIPQAWRDAIARQVEHWSRHGRFSPESLENSQRLAWEARLGVGLQPDGAFSAQDIPPGQYEVTVEDSSGSDQERQIYAKAVIDVLPVQADPQPVDVGELRITTATTAMKKRAAEANDQR